MQHHKFKITLHLRAPILSQTTFDKKHGVDTATIKDGEGKPCLLGSSIRGNLRHAWDYFIQHFADLPLNQDQINQWLGHQSAAEAESKNNPDSLNTGSYEPNRARLSFSYYWSVQDWEVKAEQQTTRHRIAIDKDTHTVKQGALQVIESPFKTGQEVCFVGYIDALLENETEKKNLLGWLDKGLNYVLSVGALRGVGFGQVKQVQIEEEAAQKNTSSEQPTQASFGIALELDRPFCFAPHHFRNNHFAAERFISGAAILGALARKLPPDSKLKQHFNQIRITHAFPEAETCTDGEILKTNQRPLTIPYSFVSADNAETLYDISLKNGVGLINNVAPAFEPDWKGKTWQAAEQLCGYADLKRSVHTHTAIKARQLDEIKTDDEEGRLFSMEVIQPDKRWLANVYCDQVPEAERQTVLKELYEVFCTGLTGLGKTKATATVACSAQTFDYLHQAQPLPDAKDQVFTVLLQTPALLLANTEALLTTNGGEVLKQRYAEAWQVLQAAEKGCFELSHFYAKQSLLGGRYLYRRFWSSEAYYPKLVTCAGSVFVFTVKDVEKTQKVLKRWLIQGVPTHPEIAGHDDWARNPYLATNGYGEVVINPQWPTLQPVGDAWNDEF